jgi:hypothetical protein
LGGAGTEVQKGPGAGNWSVKYLRVASDGTVLAASVPAGVAKTGPGLYSVHFNRDQGLIGKCVITATLNDPTKSGDAPTEHAGEISVSQATPDNAAAIGFFVYTYNSNNLFGRQEAHGFSVFLACPKK